MQTPGSGDGGDGAEERRKGNGKHKGKHDKPKPWDEDPNIDHWKVEKFDPSWNEGGMLEVSSFSTLFPQYRGMKTLAEPSFFSRYHLVLSVLPVSLGFN